MLKKIQRRFALTPLGAKNLVKACLSCTLSYLVIALGMAIIYQVISGIIDQAIPIGWCLVEMGALLILLFVVHYLQYNMTFYNTYTESARLRIEVAERLRQFPLSFFARRDLSDLTATILSDVTYMEQALSHFIPEFVGSLLATSLLCLGLFTFDWRMALASIWCIPVAFGLIGLASRRLQNAGRQDRVRQLERTKIIQEGIEAIRDLKANQAINKYLKEAEHIIEDCEKSQIRLELTNALYVVSSQLILKLGLVTTVLVGLYLLYEQVIDFKTFLLFMIVASRLYDPLNATLQNLAAMIGCSSRIERLSEIQDLPLQTGSKIFQPENYDITFEHVSFGYQEDQRVLEDISFVAKQNEVTALVGNSGGGKSTIANLACRFYDIDAGTIRIGGVDISTIDPEVLLGQVAIVFQNVVLFNGTIMENIRLGRRGATDAQVLEAAKLAYVDEFVADFEDGYETLIGENGSKLSGGQRQRISIARAILKNAPILLLDEASASLDVESETYVQKALSHLVQGRTVLMIAHRMRTITNADHLIVLKDGRILEEGKPEDLKKQKGIYWHMLSLQQKSHTWQMK